MQGIEQNRIGIQINQEQNLITNFHENQKYRSQVGLRDLDFSPDFDRMKVLGIQIPFHTIGQAEFALQSHALLINSLTEIDETEHQVLVFDPRPVGYSGFLNCATHSLTLTNHGLFEIGRYPAMRTETEPRFWQWFLHRRLASKDEVNDLCENQQLSIEQMVEKAYQAIIS